MKMRNSKLLLLIIFLLYSFIGFTQNQIIDSLNRVLQVQKEDSNKVKTLNGLSKGYLRESSFANALQLGNQALALAEKIKFKSGEAVSYLNIAEVYASQKK